MQTRWCNAILLLMANCLSTGYAFSTRAPRCRIVSSRLRVGSWDNDDFLDALSGGDKKDGAGEAKEASSVGSSRFKELMSQGEQGKASGDVATSAGKSIENPFLTTPSQSNPGNSQNLSVEEQAALFRNMMAQQEGQKGAQLPAVTRTSKTDRAGKPVGRNRDADQIANTADVYFAQLKRDSSVRTIARQHGEDEVADDVFGDEGIEQLNHLLVENPYLKGKRDQEQPFFDAAPEEMIQSFAEGEKEGLPSSGVSYKEMLQQRKANRGAIKQEASVPATPAPAPVVPPQPVQQVIPTPPPMVSTAVAQSSTSQASVTAFAPESSEDTKTMIRALMGLILKHRGGPGFGAGRLKGAESERFNDLLGKVVAVLRSEAPSNGNGVGAVASVSSVAAVQPQSPTTASASDSSGAIACMDGALTMYKNSPAGTKGSILFAVQTALKSSLTMLTGQPSPPVTQPFGQLTEAQMGKVDSAVACIDGAMLMYKNSPPNVQLGILPALEAALKSSVVMIDEVASGKEQGAATVSVQVTSGKEQGAATVSVQDTITTPQDAPSPHEGNDVNSKQLQELYDKLSAASGDGSLGLRGDLSSAEASDLAAQLVDMRGILMAELDAGIEAAPTEPGTAATPGTGSITSKYKEMLAKAKAAKS